MQLFGVVVFVYFSISLFFSLFNPRLYMRFAQTVFDNYGNHNMWIDGNKVSFKIIPSLYCMRQSCMRICICQAIDNFTSTYPRRFVSSTPTETQPLFLSWLVHRVHVVCGRLADQHRQLHFLPAGILQLRNDFQQMDFSKRQQILFAQ